MSNYFHHMNRKEFEEATQIKATCWKCKEWVDESEMFTVTDGKTSWVELCGDCYEFHQSKFGGK
ncbi:hypothetical protein [Halobacillus seohaensis]|uniref:Uncharacterized protein n=1 Tax=Halobacillus seohaensis TaxID=447421 RepID=A0ABW2EKK7_9BACI